MESYLKTLPHLNVRFLYSYQGLFGKEGILFEELTLAKSVSFFKNLQRIESCKFAKSLVLDSHLLVW